MDRKQLPGQELGVISSPQPAQDVPIDNGPFDKSSATADPESPVKHRSRLRITMILIALYLCLFVAALDATIVATALPKITADLHSAAGYIWIGGSYLIANAAAAPIWVKFSDIWGRKPIFLAAIVLFFVSSIICAAAVDMQMLIVGRSFQGAAAGGLICLVNVGISDLFSVRERSLWLGLCEGVWALSGAVGPLLGGAFAQAATWRWCFWCNLPISGTSFLLIVLFLDVHNPKTPAMDGIKAIDWFGCISILGVTVMLLLGLDLGGAVYPWGSAKVVCLIVFGSVLLFVFIYSEKKLAKYPVIPLSLFGTRNVATLMVTFFHGMVFMAGEYYLPLYFQSVKEAAPLKSGYLLAPLIVATAGTGVLNGVFIHRTGKYRGSLWLGSICLTLGTGLYIMLDAKSSIGMILGFEIIAGIGSGLMFEPPLIAIQQGVEQDDVGTATSTQSFIRALALSLSVIVGGIVFQQSMDLQRTNLAKAGLPASVLEELSGKNAGANVDVGRTLSHAQDLAVKDAFAWSIRNMWIMMTALGALGIIASLFVKKKQLSKEHRETITGLRKESIEPSSMA
ncbi:DNA repair protein RAD50 [Exophiala viscosa]|uniref:DNA repair protein RAD50 n=1 Tax=Exophiala viscosa TaxID=2486360 RepID=UPI0021994648|nr:DNA repair protein RAD50 [Exophiala viscosa]